MLAVKPTDKIWLLSERLSLGGQSYAADFYAREQLLFCRSRVTTLSANEKRDCMQFTTGPQGADLRFGHYVGDSYRLQKWSAVSTKKDDAEIHYESCCGLRDCCQAFSAQTLTTHADF